MKIRILDNTLILTWDKAVDPLVTLRTGMSLVQETSLDEDDNQVIAEIKVVYETCDLSFSCTRASLKKGLTESLFLAVQDTILSVSFKGMGFSLSASATDAYGDQVAELCFERDFSKHLVKVDRRCFDEWGDANDIAHTARLFIMSHSPEAEQNKPMKKFQFFAWIRECGEFLGMTDREAAVLILDQSWFFAFDDGLTPQEAVAEYREKCLGEERKNPPN